jgi:cell division septum initiation protein DivIVA
MDVLELIYRLADVVKRARHVPFSDDVRVNQQEIRDILDEMRATLPEEIKEARWIVQERQELLSEAKREAERIAEEGHERQAPLVSRHALVRQAERAAEEIIGSARAHERELQLGADNYADETLDTLELNLAKRIAAIQRGRERLRSTDERAEVPGSASDSPSSAPS